MRLNPVAYLTGTMPLPINKSIPHVASAASIVTTAHLIAIWVFSGAARFPPGTTEFCGRTPKGSAINSSSHQHTLKVIKACGHVIKHAPIATFLIQ
jgi:hypothetical protein